MLENQRKIFGSQGNLFSTNLYTYIFGTDDSFSKSLSQDLSFVCIKHKRQIIFRSGYVPVSDSYHVVLKNIVNSVDDINVVDEPHAIMKNHHFTVHVKAVIILRRNVLTKMTGNQRTICCNSDFK